MNVNRWKKIRPIGLLGSMAFLGLACCVFGWGLQYKLSLYDFPQPASHRLPSAKLISTDEQSRTPECLLAAGTKSITAAPHLPSTIGFLVSLLSVSLSSLVAAGQREQDICRSRHLGRGILTVFFVRPPPALV